MSGQAESNPAGRPDPIGGMAGDAGPATACDVSKQLERILADRRFQKSPSLTRFLRFAVQEALAGRGDGLKESILGGAVFDRGDAFDPRIDPIVRVQAAKLRTRLQEYYSAPGAGDPVVIELPKGAYVPAFKKRAAASPPISAPADSEAGPGAPSTEPAPAKVRLHGRNYLFAAGIAALAAAAALLYYKGTASNNQAPLRFTQLTYNRGATSFPVISRDGRLLVYSSNRESTHFSIWVQRIGEASPVRITHHDADDLTPDVSPDSRLIVFRSRWNGDGLYLTSVDGASERRIAEQAWLPRFSPDGSWISCLAARPRTDGALLVIPVTGGRPYEVSTGKVAPAASPIWSPDGKSLLFLGSANGAGKGARAYDWYLVPRIGGEPVSVGFRQALAASGFGPPDPELV